MDELWGDQDVKIDITNSDQVRLFREGKYAMLITWGLYSSIANEWNGKTYYGISEWIMHPAMAGIPRDEYMATAKTFNPVNFNAREIAMLAKDAGMKYIIAMPKHHDGFAMYHSKVDSFNIVDATPFKRDPMKELANACEEMGLGFGFYYSHNQDWTAPGGSSFSNDWHNKTFDDYFYDKCLPQVRELLTGYGKIQLIWFDTPGNIPKKYARELVDLVRAKQPGALVSGRVGHNLGDYVTFGDMEIPERNIDGLWEGIDVTNDSWGFAWYDENWKTPKTILINTLSNIARGGTFMMNIGLDPLGNITEPAKKSLLAAGSWIKKYPHVVYGVDASPWKRPMPWGDVVRKDNRLYLLVYDYPQNGKLYLHGLMTGITSAVILDNGKATKIDIRDLGNWKCFHLPAYSPEKFVAVVAVDLEGEPVVDETIGIDPVTGTYISAEFAGTVACNKSKKSWMEKFGEWKHLTQISNWKQESKATFTFTILTPGYYHIGLTYAGEGRKVWKVVTDEGASIQNQQGSSAIYGEHQIGWVYFNAPGKKSITISLEEGNGDVASLAGVQITPVEF